jgi:polysaccharide export outer membrane protein
MQGCSGGRFVPAPQCAAGSEPPEPISIFPSLLCSTAASSLRRSLSAFALTALLMTPLAHAQSTTILQSGAIGTDAPEMPIDMAGSQKLASASAAPTMQMSTSITGSPASVQAASSLLPAQMAVPVPDSAAQTAAVMTPSHNAPEKIPTANAAEPALRLGTGDAVTVQVFNRPEFNTTAYVSEDQTILVPLAGPVKVGGMSPADAASKVATALRDGQYLVNPQVSINISQFRSQQISVLGEVHTPGRYPIESKTSVLDMLAQAGGVNETGADVITLIRTSADGKVEHLPINLKKMVSGDPSQPQVSLRGGDSLFIPRAEQYYVYGEVTAPNMYRLEAGMTVVQAISRSGGLTPRGSDSRIEIKRQTGDGKYKTFSADLSDSVQPNDVIRVKERIF